MVEIKWPKNIPFSYKETFKQFLTQMCSRVIVGELRYGKPHVLKDYFSKLQTEGRAYKRTGNIEHLINIANYAYLEANWPSHPNTHLNTTAKSAYRGD